MALFQADDEVVYKKDPHQPPRRLTVVSTDDAGNVTCTAPNGDTVTHHESDLRQAPPPKK